MIPQILTGFLLLVINLVVDARAEPLDVRYGWVQLAPPGAMNLAAYMELDNPSSARVNIASISADCCAMAMLHSTERDGDRVKMLRVEEPQVPARGRLLLKPGAVHLMLMRPKADLIEGDWVNILLKFTSGETQAIRLQVMREPPLEAITRDQ